MAVASFYTVLIIAAGGAVGTVLRYALSLVTLSISRELPWGTIGINVLGSMLIGFVGTFTLAHGRFPLPENARLFVMVGVCGGFTTFSSFSLQTLDLLRGGAILRAGMNVALSVVLCLAAVAAGHLVAAHFNNHAIRVAQESIEELG